MSIKASCRQQLSPCVVLKCVKDTQNFPNRPMLSSSQLLLPIHLGWRVWCPPVPPLLLSVRHQSNVHFELLWHLQLQQKTFARSTLSPRKFMQPEKMGTNSCLDEAICQTSLSRARAWRQWRYMDWWSDMYYVGSQRWKGILLLFCILCH